MSSGIDNGFLPLSSDVLRGKLQEICSQPTSEDHQKDQEYSLPQMAKDLDYATAVPDAWREEEDEAKRNAEGMPAKLEWKSVTYQSMEDDTPLFGHLVRPSFLSQSELATKDLPGIILFHTGAGPHDVFLLWKAVSIILNFPCVVFIADILSDRTGWAWSPDRTRYNTAREHVLNTFGNDETEHNRPFLQSRIRAAVEAVALQSHVDKDRLAALGWCLGGHSILELARMRLPSVRAMVTFHGVFDGIPPPRAKEEPDAIKTKGSQILICHGVRDPFVSDENLEQALATFQHYRHSVALLQLKDAKHGFTNPAQTYNENSAFEYHQESASKAWNQAIGLLSRSIREDP